MKWPRRFCDQHDSFSSVQNGASLPLLMVRIRSAANAQAHQVGLARPTPAVRRARGCTRRCRGCRSALRRSPWWWSTLRIHSESFCSAPRPSSVRSELSRSKNTSPSGFSAFSCSSDFCVEDPVFAGRGAAGCAAWRRCRRRLAAPVSPRVVVAVAERAAASSCRMPARATAQDGRESRPFSTVRVVCHQLQATVNARVADSIQLDSRNRLSTQSESKMTDGNAKS